MRVQLEIFAGKTRAEAFRNLAQRSDEIEVRRLAQVFIDSDRFGTSLAPALRTHVHYLRLRMRQKAREKTRTVSVKLIFPLFFLIFPAVLLVTLGPAVLQVMYELRPLLANAVP
jgi:tight adherence protein C